MSTEFRFDVFLSHQHASRERVIQIAEQLRDRYGLRVWLDVWHMPHEPIQLALETGVEQSRMVIVFCTRAALESKWVETERQMAYAKEEDSLGRNLIPVLLEDVADGYISAEAAKRDYGIDVLEE